MVLGERRTAMLTGKKIIGTTRKSYFNNLAAVDISIFAIQPDIFGCNFGYLLLLKWKGALATHVLRILLRTRDMTH